MDSGNNRVIRKASLVLIIGLIASILLSLYTLLLSQEQKKSEETLETFEHVARLKRQIDSSLFVLDSIASFFGASGYVTRQEFAVFTGPLLDNSQGLKALEWVPVVKAQDKDDFARLAIRDGIYNFKFTELGGDGSIVPVSNRDVYYPVYYVEPLRGNKEALGFDLGSDPHRLKTIQHAIASQNTAATRPITLVQKIDSAFNGVLVFKPVYDGAELLGLALAVFEVESLFNLDLSQDFNYTLFTQSENGNFLVYESNKPVDIRMDDPNRDEGFQSIALANQRWFIKVTFFDRRSYQYLYVPLIVFLSAVFVSCLASYAYMQTISREIYAKRLADKREEKLNALHKKLDEQRADLFEAEKTASITGLMSCLTHELKTPIGIINTTVSTQEDLSKEMMQHFNNDTLTTSFLKEYTRRNFEAIRLIQSNNRRAISLVESYQSVSIDQAHADLRTFNVLKYTEDVLFTLKPKLKNTRHKVELNCDPKLTIHSYPGSYAQVLVNLINNSLLHGFENIGEGLITIDIAQHNDKLRIIYTDNGNGMPKENLDKIWSSRFTTKRGAGGTGLGMSIVYNLVTNVMDGEISCTSKLGEGIKFVINISTEAK